MVPDCIYCDKLKHEEQGNTTQFAQKKKRGNATQIAIQLKSHETQPIKYMYITESDNSCESHVHVIS